MPRVGRIARLELPSPRLKPGLASTTAQRCSNLDLLGAVRGQRCEKEHNLLRLNIVIPLIGKEYEFGGVSTALRLFQQLAPQFDAARIILPMTRRDEIDLSASPDWKYDCGQFDQLSLGCPHDFEGTLFIHANDFFIATAAYTALFAIHALEQQDILFPGIERRFAYFIQEFEPGFVPWSLNYFLAKSTYLKSDRTVAVFNTRRLAEFFTRERIFFEKTFLFEPRLHPELTHKRNTSCPAEKERLILVYARPNLIRNAFDLAVQGLRIWATHYPSARDWRIVSAGDAHDDIELVEGVVLQSLGKLGIEEYGDYLSRCWIGLTFMFLPHPGYPRMEMAAFNAWVITNKLEGDGFEDFGTNVLSLDVPLPRPLAERIAWCCDQYRHGSTGAVPQPKSFSEGEEFTQADELIEAMSGALRTQNTGAGVSTIGAQVKNSSSNS